MAVVAENQENLNTQVRVCDDVAVLRIPRWPTIGN